MVLIRKLKEKDIESVVLLHLNYLNKGFLANLGTEFLRDFYQSTLNIESVFTIVAIESSKPIGFLMGATNLNIFPRLMIACLWQKLILVIFLKPKILLKLIQIPFYPSFKKDIQGEILSVAVSKDFQRKGIGKLLINAAKKEFSKRNIKNYHLSVRAKMIGSNLFYKKIGMKKEKTSKFMGDEIIFWTNEI